MSAVVLAAVVPVSRSARDYRVGVRDHRVEVVAEVGGSGEDGGGGGGRGVNADE